MRLTTLVVAGLLVIGSPAFAQIPADVLARAESDDSRAQFVVGYVYATGEDVPQDQAEAARWYRLAAEQGNTDAQLYLGVIHANGRGVLANMERAYMWFSVAAAGGSGEDRDNAADNRDLVSEIFTPEQRARAEALATTCINSNFTDCGEP